MATVTMDSSEYEAHKENKRLLVETLEREKKNSEKYEELLQEKINISNKTIEDTKNLVCIKTEIVNKDIILSRKTGKSIIKSFQKLNYRLENELRKHAGEKYIEELGNRFSEYIYLEFNLYLSKEETSNTTEKFLNKDAFKKEYFNRLKEDTKEKLKTIEEKDKESESLKKQLKEALKICDNFVIKSHHEIIKIESLEKELQTETYLEQVLRQNEKQIKKSLKEFNSKNWWYKIKNINKLIQNLYGIIG